MRSKKIAILSAVLLFMAAFTVSNALADDWPINGTVVRAGMSGGVASITIKDVNTNYWTAPPATGEENEMAKWIGWKRKLGEEEI